MQTNMCNWRQWMSVYHEDKKQFQGIFILKPKQNLERVFLHFSPNYNWLLF